MGFLKVVGNKIVDESGNRVVLKGVNIADVEHLNTKPWERPDVDAYKIALAAVEKCHAKVVRIPVMPGNSDYPNEGFFSQKNGGEKYFQNHLDPVVKLLTSKGIYVIIDLHYVKDFYGMAKEVQKFWTFMAPKYKDNPFVFYEIFNEPIEPDNWKQWHKEIAQPTVDLIRKLAPNNLVLVGGPYWSSHMLGAVDLPVKGNNVAYVAHIYSNQSNYDEHYKSLADKYPLFITEWGFEKGGTEGGDIKYGKKFEAWMRLNQLSWTCWSYDTQWGPRMVNSDWSLKKGNGGMGEFVVGLLKDS